MRDWLRDPPGSLTLREDLDGVTITFPATGGIRAHLIDLLGVLTMFPLVIGGAALGVLPWMRILESGVVLFILGFLGACVTAVIGMSLGFALAAGIQTQLEKLIGVQREASVRLLEHTIVLAEESVALSEALFVDGDAEPELVLRGGRRVPIAPGTVEENRRWIGGVIGTFVRQRSEGSEEDIPETLRQLKRPEQPTWIG